jgi:hypothetical protein
MKSPRPGVVFSSDVHLSDGAKFQAPSIKYQTNNKSQVSKSQTTARISVPPQTFVVWCICGLSFVCDLMLVIWNFGYPIVPVNYAADDLPRFSVSPAFLFTSVAESITEYA